jgi:hypothetical protein
MKANIAASWQAAVCLLSAATVWLLGRPLEGTEFSSGRLTGRLLVMQEIGLLLFVAALVLVFFHQRLAAAISSLGCLLCFPLCFCFVAPGLFRSIFGGVWSTQLPSNLTRDNGPPE